MPLARKNKLKSAAPKQGYVCVFAGFQLGTNEAYVNDAQQLGHLLAERGFGVIYGGQTVGLIGALAAAARAAGAPTTAVLLGSEDESLLKLYAEKTGAVDTELVGRRTLESRKREMLGRAIAAIALPGGLGTNDEVATALEIGRRKALTRGVNHLVLLNTLGFYNGLEQQVDAMVAAGFLSGQTVRPYYATDPEDVIQHIEGVLDGAQ